MNGYLQKKITKFINLNIKHRILCLQCIQLNIDLKGFVNHRIVLIYVLHNFVTSLERELNSLPMTKTMI